MSNVSKPCNVKPSSETVLMAYDDCNKEHEISIADLELVPQTDVEAALQTSPTISWMKAKDQQLQNQIDNINNVKLDTLTQAAQNATTAANEAAQAVEDEQQVISELNDNIVMLKGWNVRQDAAIKWLSTKVIVDTTYNNFDEWVENVYIPQCESIANKFSRWDIYINANQNIAATNATYINVKSPNSTAPCSANDWQEQYYSAPADVITYLGIDPLVVTHPFKHEWTVAIDPYKFQDFMAGLQRLDLTNVEVSLWEVYFDPVIKESLKVQEDLEVGNLAKTKDLNVTGNATVANATITNATIPTITGNTAINGRVTVTGGTVTDDLNVTWTATVANASITTLDVGTLAWTTTFSGKSTFTAGIDVDEIDVSNKADINRLEATTAKIDRVTDPIAFEELLTAEDWITTDSLTVTNTATIKNANLTWSTTVERFDGTVDLSDNVTVWGTLWVTWPATFAWQVTARTFTAQTNVALPGTANITVNGQNFETWLVNFGNQHWQQR